MVAIDQPMTGGKISLAHGGGGQLTDELISQCILPRLGNNILSDLLDSAIFPPLAAGEKPTLTIDSYVVQPLFFPGGDIGRLCVSGTVNDLAVCGARPLGIALSLILTEGLPKNTLEKVMDSIAATATEAGVKIVTGDTKVVGHAQGDGVYITTAGIGAISDYKLHPDLVEPGDAIIVSGNVADHGMAVMLARQMPQMQSSITSDVAPLNHMIAGLLKSTSGVVFLRDPTRGGLAGVCADLANRTGRHITLEEDSIPIDPRTRHVADMLGSDPLDVANEGKVVAVVRPGAVKAALAALHGDRHGLNARVIGHVDETGEGVCELHTTLGGRRILLKAYGEQLPRIC